MSISLDAVRDEGLLRAGGPVVVLFSGGRDSTCLLDLAVRIAGAEAVSALHVNYGLRDGADGDERQCRSCVSGSGWRSRSGARAVPNPGTSRAGRATSATAPRPRSRLSAGPTSPPATPPPTRSRRSSIGWPPRRAAARCSGCGRATGSLLRPLLNYTREQTAEYCSERGLEWREDESNDQDAYARARIRSRLVPALREIHPAAEENVLALAAILRDEAAVLDAAVDGRARRSGRDLARAPARAPRCSARARRSAAGRRRRRWAGAGRRPAGHGGRGAARPRAGRGRSPARRPGRGRWRHGAVRADPSGGGESPGRHHRRAERAHKLTNR